MERAHRGASNSLAVILQPNPCAVVRILLCQFVFPRTRCHRCPGFGAEAAARDWDGGGRMGLLRKREKNSIDRRLSLAGIPFLHDGVEVVEAGAGLLVLKVKVNRGPGFLDRFRPPVTEKKYELDEFGSFVVRHLQRGVSVMDIIQAFEREFRMSHRESELGVVAFVKMLMQRNLLSVELKQGKG